MKMELKLSTFVAVLAASLMMTPLHAAGKSADQNKAREHGNNHHTNSHSVSSGNTNIDVNNSNAQGFNSQADTTALIKSFNFDTASIDARVRYEERLAERQAEREAEASLLKIEKQKANDLSENEDLPVEVSTTSTKSVVTDPAAAF